MMMSCAIQIDNPKICINAKFSKFIPWYSDTSEYCIDKTFLNTAVQLNDGTLDTLKAENNVHV